MAKRNSLILVDKKMYKHFAIVTIALTGGMALFADGEKREAVAQGVEAVRTYEPEVPKEAKLIINNDQMNEGGSYGGFYNVGSENISFAEASSMMPGETTNSGISGSVTAAQLEQIGMTMAQYQVLPPEEREKIKKQLGIGLTAEERREIGRQEAAASASRSGGGQGLDY